MLILKGVYNMKRFIALLMAIMLVMTLASCGNESEKAEKYCWNCGEGITKDVAFCPSCGTEQGATDEKATSTTAKTTQKQNNTTTQKPTQKPTATQKPATTQKPAHKHSYSKKVVAATCTAKGYTVYTCSCGDTYKGNYTNPSHSYSKYQCTKCGIHDKEHTYEFLVEYVKKVGKPFATGVSIDIYNNGNVSLTYNAETNDLYIYTLSESGPSAYWSISLKTYFYGMSGTFNSGQKIDVTGYLDAKNYTAGSPLGDVHYDGPSDLKYPAIESARAAIEHLVKALSDFSKQNGNMKLTMADMGFSSY